MHIADYLIVGIYLVGLMAFGVWLAPRAGENSESYFLGGRKLPWWALGASGMSSNLDVAGTMTIVSLLYLYGLQGFFIEMRGGVVLPIAVFLAFMGKWHRRSEVMTTAEWMVLRFGGGWQGKLARITAAGTYLLITVAMVAFFTTAGGKFLSVFLPFSPEACSLGAASIALVYTVMSGLYGVIWTDVIQAFLIAAAAIYVTILATIHYSPVLLDSWPGAQFNQFLPLWHETALGPYEWFGLFLMAWAGKGLLEGLGGSAGSAYMSQRFYAAGSDRDCQKIGMLWTVLFAFRWPMVLGFVVLAVSRGLDVMDAEQVLPSVLQTDWFPPGVRGLMLAAMLAAAMSTFDSTINAGASYVVKDLFGLWRPHAGERAQVKVAYAASFLLVALGVGVALLFQHSVLDAWVNIVIKLFPAFLVPFALRWFWSRLNGLGFSAGVIAGFGAAVAVPGDWSELITLGSITLVSTVVSVWVTLVSPPVREESLRSFHDKIRPLGLWPNSWKTRLLRQEHRLDIGRLGVAVAWQVVTFLLPMSLVLHHWLAMTVLSLMWIGGGIYLWRDLKHSK